MWVGERVRMTFEEMMINKSVRKMKYINIYAYRPTFVFVLVKKI